MSESQLNVTPFWREFAIFFMRFALTLSFAFTFSLLLSNGVWRFDIISIHTVLEGFCIVIGLSAFFLVVNTHERNEKVSIVIGYGFFVVILFNVIHAFLYISNTNLIYHEIFTAYCITAHLAVVVVLLLSQFNINYSKKWASIFFAGTAAIALAWIILARLNNIPILFLKNCIFFMKSLSGYVAILALIVTAILIKKQKNYQTASDKYLFLAVVTAIAAELCLAFFPTQKSLLFIYGHQLKAVYYYYLFRSIFINVVDYPYEKLEKESRQLHNILKSMPAEPVTCSDDLKVGNLELQTQTILNSISNAVIIIDKSRKIIMCNHALEQICEMNSRELIGMSIGKFYEILKFSTRLQNRQKTRDTRGYEVELITPSGNKKELLVHMSEILDLDGEGKGSIIVGTDITNVKEEQLRLRQKDKLALLGQMGASIVHETKNMLASIKGYSQLIAMKEENPHIREYAQKINFMTEEVNRVIVEFLELSKPREFVPTRLYLNDMLRSIRYMLESSAILKGINIQIMLDSDEKAVFCDESAMKQVVLNMVKNAVEAVCDTPEPKLTVQTRLDREADEMQIIIGDNGKGMSEDVLANLGTPFFTTKKTGTGLGMSVCYKIVQDHNGRINVKSAPGSGTVFTISLPCAV